MWQKIASDHTPFVSQCVPHVSISFASIVSKVAQAFSGFQHVGKPYHRPEAYATGVSQSADRLR